MKHAQIHTIYACHLRATRSSATNSSLYTWVCHNPEQPQLRIERNRDIVACVCVCVAVTCTNSIKRVCQQNLNCVVNCWHILYAWCYVCKKNKKKYTHDNQQKKMKNIKISIILFCLNPPPSMPAHNQIRKNGAIWIIMRFIASFIWCLILLNSHWMYGNGELCAGRWSGKTERC